MCLLLCYYYYDYIGAAYRVAETAAFHRNQPQQTGPERLTAAAVASPTYDGLATAANWSVLFWGFRFTAASDMDSQLLGQPQGNSLSTIQKVSTNSTTAICLDGGG